MHPSEAEHPAAYQAAIERRIRANARKTWLRTAHRAQEIEDFLAGEPVGEFLQKMAHSLDTYGKLSEGQTATVARIIDDRAAARAIAHVPVDGGKYLGTVGQRLDMELTVKRWFRSENEWGVSYFLICETADGITVIYKGSSMLAASEGVTFKCKATIKEHGQRKGYAQTIIARPKLAKPE